MSRFVAFVIVLLLSIANIRTQTRYRLYMEPSTIAGPFTTVDQISINAIIPENHDLIILYTLQDEDMLVVTFHGYSNGNLQEQNFDRKIRFQIGFINAFWVRDQFLLLVRKSLTIIFRPAFYGWQQKTEKFEYNGTILQSTVVQSEGKEYLIVIEDGNESWIMKKYQLETENKIFLKFINQTQFKKTHFQENTIRLIRTKHFTCLLISNSQDQEYRIYGINFDNNATVNFSINTSFVVRQGDLKTDSIFLLQINGRFIMKYSISQNGIDIQNATIKKTDPQDYLSYQNVIIQQYINIIQ